MKKLFYLLPFLILNFCFAEYIIKNVNNQIIVSSQFSIDEAVYVGFTNGGKLYEKFCLYEYKGGRTFSYSPFDESIVELKDDDFYVGSLTNFNRFKEKYEIRGDYFKVGLIYEKNEDTCEFCNSLKGEYFNSDTGLCETNCDLIPNLKLRSDCMCKKQGYGDVVKVSDYLSIVNDNVGDDTGGLKCQIQCENGDINELDISYCNVDDTHNNREITNNCEGCDFLNPVTDNNKTDDDSVYDYCKAHPEIEQCRGISSNNNDNIDNSSNNSSSGNSGSGGNSQQNFTDINSTNSTNADNNSQNINTNSDNNKTNSTITTIINNNQPSKKDDEKNDDLNGECKGENCTPNDITSDYKKMLDDAQGKFDGAYSDTKNQLDGLIDTAKNAINDIKNGGFIQHGKIRITTCPIKSEVINFGFFSYRFEYDLCDWLTKLYNVFYFLTLVTCLFYGLKWILSHIFNIGGSE